MSQFEWKYVCINTFWIWLGVQFLMWTNAFDALIEFIIYFAMIAVVNLIGHFVWSAAEKFLAILKYYFVPEEHEQN